MKYAFSKLAKPEPSSCELRAAGESREAAESTDQETKTASYFSQERQLRLGAFFREKREEVGLTLSQVAEQIEFTEADLIGDCEEGKKPFPLHLIYSLTICLNLPPDAVFALIYDMHGEQARE